VVFEVKYLKYTLFVPILPGSMKAALDHSGTPPLDYHVGTAALGCTSSAARHFYWSRERIQRPPCLLIPHSSRIIDVYVVRIGREQFLPQQPVTSRSTSESIQRKLIKQRNT
jgi:hypothetical protein